MTSVDTNLQTDPFILARDLSGKHFYAGEMRASLSGKVFPVINPATGEQVAEAAFGEAADVEAAVQEVMRRRRRGRRSAPATGASWWSSAARYWRSTRKNWAG
jgi:acyl-CoA reductase-like NAD-dependent aldehyde dehydrogenase